MNFFPLYIYYLYKKMDNQSYYELKGLSFLDFKFEPTESITLGIDQGYITLGPSIMNIPYESMSYGNPIKLIVTGKTISTLSLKLFAPYPVGVDKTKLPLYWTPDSETLDQWRVIHPTHLVT